MNKFILTGIIALVGYAIGFATGVQSVSARSEVEDGKE